MTQHGFIQPPTQKPLSKDSSVKFTIGAALGAIGAVAGATWVIANKLNSIDTALRDNHRECLEMIQESRDMCQSNYNNCWHLSDAVEWTHQYAARSNTAPPISEVLRETRALHAFQAVGPD